MELLTGKCKEEFNKWFMENEPNAVNSLGRINYLTEGMLVGFYKLPFSMQYGG